MRYSPLIVLLLLIGGCAVQKPSPLPGMATLEVTSPVFSNGGSIPQKYTCQGEDSSPALSWSVPPAGTKSLALLVEDPDAPAGTWVHWIVYNMPPNANGLPEGASQGKASQFHLPQNSIQGKTSFNRADYGGPCPPTGSHRYYFRLYALDITLDKPSLNKSALLAAMDGHILATGELMGTYQKQ